MEVIDFWMDFAYQHATFSEHSGLQAGSKIFMPNNPTVVFHNAGVQAGASAAKLAYDLALFANRQAIVRKVQLVIGNQFSTRIRASAPAKGSGGVLISYMVDYIKKKDAMGSTIGTYSHQQGIGILGAGPNALVPYKRVFSPQQATISSGKGQVAPPKSVNRVVCFMWVFRK